MKKFLSVVLASSLILAASGCAKGDDNEASQYGEEIFVCDPDNMFGFEGLYIDEDTLVLNFDEDYISDEPYSRSITNFFDHDELFANDHIYILTDGDSIVIDADDIEVDGDDYVLTISDVDIDADEITGIDIYTGGTQCTVDIDEGTLTALLWGGECSDTYTQEYNSRRDSWSDIEHELDVYPMTVVETEIEVTDPDVEPNVEPARSSSGMIVPYLAEYIEDEYMPEYNEYLYGFTDLEGNVIYEPQFRSVQYIRELEVYIVSIDDNGLYKFGLISEEGDLMTNIEFDGAFYEAGVDETDPGHINLTTYEEGVLHPVSYDMNNMSVLPDIAIDESILPFDAATASLTVCHLGDNGALIENASAFYPHRVIIDRNTGELLHDFDTPYGSELIFGDLVIEYAMNGGVAVYDITGTCLFDEPDAYGSRLNPYRFLIAFDGQMAVIDREGDDAATMPISPNAQVETAAGLIAVYDDGNTTVYDEDFNIVAEAGDYDVDDGYCPGSWTDEYQQDAFYYVSFGNHRIYNVLSGDYIPVDEGYFYSYVGGYILADNRSDGNTDDYRWRVYDSSFNLIREEEGFANRFADEVTGDIYISASNNGITTIYDIDNCEPVFEIEGDYGLYTCRAYDGYFCMTDLNESILVDSSGQILFTCDIST